MWRDPGNSELCFVVFHCWTIASSFKLTIFFFCTGEMALQIRNSTCCCFWGLGSSSQHPLQAAYCSSRSRDPFLSYGHSGYQAPGSCYPAIWVLGMEPGSFWEQHALLITKFSLQLHLWKYFKCSKYDTKILWCLLFLQEGDFIAEIECNTIMLPWCFWSHD